MLAVIVVSILAAASASCPSKCKCVSAPRENRVVSVDCRNAGFNYIPYTLDPRIKSLDLSGNKLIEIRPDELSSYRDLEFLDLSHNSIQAIPSSAFHRLSKLKGLKLSSNIIESLNVDQFVSLSSLKVLDLSQNDISRIPTSAFVDMVRLELFNLSRNVLMDISPGAFVGLGSLKELSLENNALGRIPPVAFRPLTQLRILNLAHNVLNSLETNSFRKQTQLTHLDLRSNSLQSIDHHAFRGLRSLKFLSLDFNELPSVPSLPLSTLRSLTTLNLRGNRFPTIATSAFDGLSKLTQLTLTNCASLKSVQMNAFSGLFSLETLTLTENPSLSEISPFAFEQDTRLRHVYLTGNNLTSLADGAFSVVRLETLDVRRNPWTCDCALKWLADHLRTRDPQFSSSYSPATCFGPEAMAGRPLTDPAFDDGACAKDAFDRRIITTVILLGGVLFFLSVITIAVFTCRRQLGGMARKYGFMPPASPNPSTSTYLDPKYYCTSVKSGKSLAGDSKGGVSNCYYYTDDLWLAAEEQRSFLSSSGYYSNISLQKSPKQKDGTLYKVVSKYPVPITEL